MGVTIFHFLSYSAYLFDLTQGSEAWIWNHWKGASRTNILWCPAPRDKASTTWVSPEGEMKVVGNPYQKPLPLYFELLKRFSPPGSTVVELTAGSGTLLATCLAYPELAGNTGETPNCPLHCTLCAVFAFGPFSLFRLSYHFPSPLSTTELFFSFLFVSYIRMTALYSALDRRGRWWSWRLRVRVGRKIDPARIRTCNLAVANPGHFKVIP